MSPLLFQTVPEIRAVVLEYDRQCGSGNPCNSAIQALEDETSCQSAETMNPRAICSETCTTLYFAIIDACPNVGGAYTV